MWEAEGEVMYTVLVLEGSEGYETTLADLAASISRQSSLNPMSARRRGGGYACDICKSDDWSAHLSAVNEFLSEHGKLLRSASGAGLAIRFDTAVDSGVLGGGGPWTTFSYPSHIIKRLAISGAEVAITIYQTEPA
jgi:hypothetical protein